MSAHTTRSTADLIRDRDEAITPDDLRSKLNELQGGVESTAESAKGIALAAGAAVAVVLVLGVFALGLRRGKKRTTVVEIRRV